MEVQPLVTSTGKLFRGMEQRVGSGGWSRGKEGAMVRRRECDDCTADCVDFMTGCAVAWVGEMGGRVMCERQTDAGSD